jgi:hypothetical protein
MRKFARINNIYKNVSSNSRFKANIGENGPWPKPNNPWDNLQPDRLDKNVVDEYGK